MMKMHIEVDKTTSTTVTALLARGAFLLYNTLIVNQEP